MVLLMLELITARKPIERGKYIVKEVRTTLDKTEHLYNLQTVLDQEIVGFERFVDLAMRCVEDEGVDRPTMSEGAREIETIAQHPGSNLDKESTSTSVSRED
ncbi:hypothetical protein L484_016492 [Morus notabilis]|uniref:Uncharacterized protein n=1 Tax=Morus notabilis TaxID=981085 RepID=W9QGA3_9ROSA|nr:hypothetical protein L484_016492 [Morus notabilis]